MLGFRPEDLLVILLVAFFLFGGKRLPEIGRSLGQAFRRFKRAMDEGGKPEAKERQQDGRQETEN